MTQPTAAKLIAVLLTFMCPSIAALAMTPESCLPRSTDGVLVETRSGHQCQAVQSVVDIWAEDQIVRFQANNGCSIIGETFNSDGHWGITIRGRICGRVRDLVSGRILLPYDIKSADIRPGVMLLQRGAIVEFVVDPQGTNGVQQ